MKKAFAIVFLAAFALFITIFIASQFREGTEKKTTSETPTPRNGAPTDEFPLQPQTLLPATGFETNRSLIPAGKQHIPSRAERLKMSPEERVRLMENLGCVPPDSDWSDYALGEKTSWWGKRLDLTSFWSNRVIWLDGTATGEAWRHGRSYPPMPYDDPSVADLSDKDATTDGFDIQGGPNLHLVSTDREHVFWGNFAKTHPHPPDDISRWQRDQADSWLRYKNILEHDPKYADRLRMKPERLDRMLEAKRREAEGLGFPPECLTHEAYRWSHILQKRQEYEALRANRQHTDSRTLSNFFQRVYVDRRFITEPLSAEDIQAANAWKVAYLRRLRQENTDESYINAYIQAWNLSLNEVFGMTP